MEEIKTRGWRGDKVDKGDKGDRETREDLVDKGDKGEKRTNLINMSITTLYIFAIFFDHHKIENFTLSRIDRNLSPIQEQSI